jgi:hypothetical protein
VAPWICSLCGQRAGGRPRDGLFQSTIRARIGAQVEVRRRSTIAQAGLGIPPPLRCVCAPASVPGPDELRAVPADVGAPLMSAGSPLVEVGAMHMLVPAAFG